MVPRDTATRPPVFCNYKVTPGPFLRNPLNGESVSRDEMPKKLNIVVHLCSTPLASPSRWGPPAPVLPPRGPWPRPRWGGPLPVRVETPEPGRRPARAFLRARSGIDGATTRVLYSGGSWPDVGLAARRGLSRRRGPRRSAGRTGRSGHGGRTSPRRRRRFRRRGAPQTCASAKAKKKVHSCSQEDSGDT